MKHLFFDLDGTLADSSQGILNCFTDTFTELGLASPTKESLKTLIGPPLETSFARFMQLDQVAEAVTIYRKYYKSKGIKEVHLYPDIKDMLEGLVKKRYLLYVATSKYQPMALEMLSNLDVDKYFTGIFGSLGAEPKADVIQRVLDTHQIQKERAYMIGDTAFDMVGGRTKDLKTIGVTWGFGSPESLLENGADILVNHPLQILKELESF